MKHRSSSGQHRPFPRATVVAIAALLLAACGTGDQAGIGDGDANVDASGEEATRTVTHALGTTDIPADPERIVALWGPTLSALLTLGEEPVAAVEQGYVEGVDVPDSYDLDQLVLTGSSREPNLELVASVEPDLIIGIENFIDAERYDQLSQIAPTVLFEWEGSGAWQQHLDEVADALGLDDEVVDDVGLARPQPQDFVDEGFRAVSLERLADADGDVLFFWANDEEGQELVDRARQNPLWTSLEVVQDDAAHTVDGEVWGTASYFAAHQVLDDLEAVLGGDGS